MEASFCVLEGSNRERRLQLDKWKPHIAEDSPQIARSNAQIANRRLEIAKAQNLFVSFNPQIARAKSPSTPAHTDLPIAPPDF